MDEPRDLTAVIRRITNDHAQIDLAGQTITWPRQSLPEGIQEGDSVQLRMLTEQAAQTDRQELARTILAEILGGKS